MAELIPNTHSFGSDTKEKSFNFFKLSNIQTFCTSLTQETLCSQINNLYCDLFLFKTVYIQCFSNLYKFTVKVTYCFSLQKSPIWLLCCKDGFQWTDEDDPELNQSEPSFEHGGRPLQQHLLSLWIRLPLLLFLFLHLLPHARAKGGFRLRPHPLHFPRPTDRPLLPDPFGPVPQHAVVYLDRLHGEGHVWLPDFLTGSLRGSNPDNSTRKLRQRSHWPIMAPTLMHIFLLLFVLQINQSRI